MKMGNAPPFRKFRAGSVSVAVWKNKGNRNGREVEFFTVSLDRAYKLDGQWKTSAFLRESDVADALLVLGKAQELLRMKAVPVEEAVRG